MTDIDRRHHLAKVKARRSTRLLAVALGLGCVTSVALAQSPPQKADTEVKKQTQSASPAKRPAPSSNTTVVERGIADAKGGAPASGTQLKLVALLTADGQQIDQGLVWRVFLEAGDTTAKSKLVAEAREPSPSLKLQPGDYTINAAFGRANLTRKITIKPGTAATEQFVLNAGGLRVNPNVSGKPAPANTISYAIYSDDRDQFANRSAVMAGARPGLVIRLNAGIYHVVSTYGDANAKVETDVTVEAGKLTEASLVHTAGRANFKLVTRTGGEALPDTHWAIQAAGGETVKESVGALPTHILAPGTYTVTAKAGGRVYKRQFTLKDGDMTNIEVMMEGAEPQADTGDLNPSLEIKSP